MKKLYSWLIVLNALALPVTAYLIYLHFEPSASTICNISKSFNCEIVNKSTYAELFGIPVSIFGFLTYLSLLIFTIRGFFNPESQRKFLPHALAFLSFGVLFSLYLTSIEAFILQTFCLFCVIQQIIILSEWGILWKMWRKA